MKSKLETSAMVRISNKHIRKAKKIKKLTGIPVGKIFEDALDYYDNSSYLIAKTAKNI